MKITIDNEEVLCSNDFTINQEMLNTPSVILNNVYPKSWELDKDYTSRFYHPNDYTQCKIFDEIPAEPGVEITGENITTQSVDLDKLYEWKLMGNTTQNGTPTPSAPVEIKTITGNNLITITGNNLLPTSEDDWEQGTINSSSGDNQSSTKRMRTKDYYPISPGKHYASIQGTGYVWMNLEYYDENWEFIKAQSAISTVNGLTEKVLNVPAGTAYFRAVIRNTDTNATVLPSEITLAKAQIEDNSKNDFEEYKSITNQINLGKNMWGGFASDFSRTNNHVSFVNNADGTFTADGTASSAAASMLATQAASNNRMITLEPGNYVLSGNITGCRLQLCDSSNTVVAATSTSVASISFTLAERKKVFLRLYVVSGTQLDNITVYPMLERGYLPTTYSPYFIPIELCKIGDYQDYIYKQNNKWYIHKDIGKITDDAGSLNITINDMVSNASIYSYCGGTVSDKTITYDSALVETNTIYYPLETPTDTEITDSTLLSQLNAVSLYSGVNNIFAKGYLNPQMYLHYNYTLVGEDIHFCGVVKNSGNISLNPRYPHYSTLQILDYKTFLSEGETLDFVIANKTILEALQQVVSVISGYGFQLGNVNILNPNDLIGAYSTKDKTAYDVFNYIADITQSRWTTRVLGAGSVAIDFYDPSLMPQGTPINYNDAWFCQNKIIDMKYNYGTWNYRNKQVMTSNQVIANITQSQIIITDGYARQFETEQRIGNIYKITLNDVELSVATNEQKEIGIDADIYYTPGNNNFSSDRTFTVGGTLVITYYPIVEGRQIVNNVAEIERVAEDTGTIGKISRYENRNDATTSLELQKIGQSYIKYKGVPEINLTIKSESNLWNIGDRVYFNSPIAELTTEYMVKKKAINYIITADKIFYTFELTSSFNSETEINYFDNQRAKANGNIAEGQYISRNIDIENQATIIFYDTEVEEIVPNNELQSELEIILGG